MLTRRTVVRTSLIGGLAAGTAGLGLMAAYRHAPGPPDNAGWRPIDWPFPRDGWPPGRAWRRDEIAVYVRPKLGFCGNCDTGVVTDEEVDRVTDIDLLDERFAPTQAGAPVRIADLPGRARLYRYALKNGALRHAEGIAVSQKCDLVVAVVAGNLVDERARSTARQFLETSTVQDWLKQQLEGR